MRRAPHPAPRDPYWNHNTAYHPWILSQLRPGMRVLDVGCGDGLLAAKLAAAGCRPTGLEPDAAAFARAAARLGGVPTAPATQTLNELRALSRELLPGARLRRALYYRVLLSWQKRELP